MISRREAIVREVLARITAAIAPIAVLRQPTLAIPREKTPAVILTVESDNPAKRANDRMEREMVVHITALSRDPADGWAQADDLVCRVHAALLADQTLGGLVLAIVEGEADWQAEDADLDAVAVPATYRITYRTLVSDITQGG